MKIDVEKIKTAYEAASAEQKEQIEKMFPGALKSAKSKDPEETLETLVGKLRAWQDQNKDERAVALFAADKDRTEEEGNTAICCIVGSTGMLIKTALSVLDYGKDIKKPLVNLFAHTLMSKVKDNLENNLKDSKHGTGN